MMDAITVLGMLAVVCGMPFWVCWLWCAACCGPSSPRSCVWAAARADPKIRKTGRRLLRERFRPCFLCFE